ncbi:MAG: trigger factor [Pseudomonadota bacterium]
MQVSVEESGAIERKLTISVPAENVNQEIDKRLKNVARQAKIPGFRPGKAPQNVIRQRYAGQITNEVISDTINSSYREALGETEITPAGLVSIEPKPYDEGEGLEYVATIEVFPEIPTPTLEGQTIENPVCEVTADDIDRTLEDIRQRNADYSDKEDASAEGDRVTIDFEGTIDGEPFNGGSAQDFPFVLGEGQMLEEFDSGLRGVRAGETAKVEFTFPEDYHGEDVAGKDVSFDVTVKKVEVASLPEIDDAFAERLGISEGGLAKMQEEIETSLNRELNQRLRATQRDRVMKALQDANDIPTPRAMVEEEIDRAIESINEQMKSQGLPAQELDRSNYEEDAKRRVALGLIAREVIQKHELKVDADRVRARIEEMAEGYDDCEAFVNYYYGEPARLQQIEAMVLEEQLVEAMMATATVKEVTQSFQEFMNPAAGS